MSSKLLIYADDIKLFNTIRSPLDQTRLQLDLQSIVSWARDNELILNIDKCTVISFHRGDHLDTNYVLGDTELRKVVEQRDLGVIFQDNFEFDKHVHATVSKAYRVLGFVIRSSRKFGKEVVKYMYMGKSQNLGRFGFSAYEFKKFNFIK